MGAARAEKRHTDLGHSHKVLIQVAGYSNKKHNQVFITTKYISWISEVVGRRWSVKQVFLNILQNSQENSCTRFSILINWQA